MTYSVIRSRWLFLLTSSHKMSKQLTICFRIIFFFFFWNHQIVSSLQFQAVRRLRNATARFSQRPWAKHIRLLLITRLRRVRTYFYQIYNVEDRVGFDWDGNDVWKVIVCNISQNCRNKYVQLGTLHDGQPPIVFIWKGKKLTTCNYKSCFFFFISFFFLNEKPFLILLI